MATAAEELLAHVTGALWPLVASLGDAAAASLAGLRPQPGYAGTPLDGRLLEPTPPPSVPDPAAAALLALVTGLLPGPEPVRLHGWDPGGGRHRGLALVAPAGPGTVALAVTGGGAPAVEVVTAAGAPVSGSVGLASGWILDVATEGAGGIRAVFQRAGPATSLAGEGSVTITLRRAPGAAPVRLGPDAGPRATVRAPVLRAIVRVTGGVPAATVAVGLHGADLTLVPGVLAAVLGGAPTLAADIDVAADATGLHLGDVGQGSALSLMLPARLALPAVEVRALTVTLAAAPGGEPALVLRAALSLRAALPGLPLELRADGLGADFPVVLGAGGRVGLDTGGVRPALPAGMGAQLGLEVVSGGGYLAEVEGGYGGMLELDFGVVAVTAFGLLQTGADGALSLVVLFSVTFPGAGIQLGFGFSLNAVGGLVGINRRVDVQALQRAVLDGSAATLLFPVDPARHARRIIRTLERAFPPAPGHSIVGSMLQLAWGGRILTMSVAVLIEAPTAKLVVLGRTTLALPDPEAPLILLQAVVLGTLDPNVPSASVTATLHGSHILGVTIQGDMFLLVRGGWDAVFVLSVGGFHPRYQRPAGVPELRRVAMDLSPLPLPKLRAEAYFALTANSLQFGARLELSARIAGCGLAGWFVFDALVAWDDKALSFTVHCQAGVAVQAFGRTLLGVHLDLLLEGPQPWHVHGRASVSLFVFHVPLNFDRRWGSSSPAVTRPAADPVGVGGQLRAALANQAAWSAEPPAADRSLVVLSEQVPDGGVHPLGRLLVRQRVVPLEVQISRFQNAMITPQRWAIQAAQVGHGGGRPGPPWSERFATGAYQELSEADKLTKPAFQSYRCGLELSSDELRLAEARPVDLTWETSFIEGDWERPPVRFAPSDAIVGEPLDAGLIAELFVMLEEPDLSKYFEQPDPLVIVDADQVLVAATTDTLQAVELAGAPESLTQLEQALAATDMLVGPAGEVQIVEQWELGP
jgi:hypothetical protein